MVKFLILNISIQSQHLRKHKDYMQYYCHICIVIGFAARDAGCYLQHLNTFVSEIHKGTKPNMSYTFAL
jgi:hypothetical protein